MFTGIVEEQGIIERVTDIENGTRFEITSPTLFQSVPIGASIAVNGCCLTAVESVKGRCSFDVIEETFHCTAFETIQEGDAVNLERSMVYGSHVDGHLVQGHVDGVGVITKYDRMADGSHHIEIEAPKEILCYVVTKGSVAIDGVSLTVTSVHANAFAFSMIPHTKEVTTLQVKRVGSLVNIEVDLMAKYIERLLPKREIADASC